MLPSASMSDTYSRIASIKISKSEPWMLQELVSGPQYAAHCLIVNNAMCGLVISSLSSRQFEKAMPPDAALHGRISDFVDSLVRHLPQSTTTHLNVRFVLCESSTAHAQQAFFMVRGRNHGLRNASQQSIHPQSNRQAPERPLPSQRHSLAAQPKMAQALNVSHLLHLSLNLVMRLTTLTSCRVQDTTRCPRRHCTSSSNRYYGSWYCGSLLEMFSNLSASF